MLPEPPPTGTTQPEPPNVILQQIDLKRLAEEIFALLKQELRLENERGVRAGRDREGNHAHFR